MVCVAEPTFGRRVAVLGLAADRGAMCEVLSALGPATPGRGELLRLDIADVLEADVLMFFLSKSLVFVSNCASSRRHGRLKNNEELERVLKASQIIGSEGLVSWLVALCGEGLQAGWWSFTREGRKEGERCSQSIT